jgi:hypothetical protein
MKSPLITTLASLLALCSYAGPKEDIQAAATKLADAPCYTWTTTTAIEGAQNAPGVVIGKADKDGYAVVSQERQGNTTMAVLKGDKGVVKTDSGWQTAEDLRAAAQAGGGGRGGGMRGALLLRTALPAAEAAKLATKTAELKASDGAIAGDLTPEAAKEMLSFGRGRPGGQGQGPEVKNAKGSVKYWLKDGALVKMQVQVSGTIAGRNGDRDMARTTTHEFKDVGTTKVEVPEEAKKKLGA